MILLVNLLIVIKYKIFVKKINQLIHQNKQIMVLILLKNTIKILKVI